MHVYIYILYIYILYRYFICMYCGWMISIGEATVSQYPRVISDINDAQVASVAPDNCLLCPPFEDPQSINICWNRMRSCINVKIQVSTLINVQLLFQLFRCLSLHPSPTQMRAYHPHASQFFGPSPSPTFTVRNMPWASWRNEMCRNSHDKCGSCHNQQLKVGTSLTSFSVGRVPYKLHTVNDTSIWLGW